MNSASQLIANRYQLNEKLGSGSYADTWLAIDLYLNRQVAVKVLRPEHTASHDGLLHFKREFQTAASIMHPNVVATYDAGESDGLAYLVMEWVDGITLKQEIRTRRRLDIQRTITVTHGILAGLSSIHALGIIHRDIKPQNVLVNEHGAIKLTDFGIARIPDESEAFADNSTIGSAAYMAPEQAQGQPVTPAADIYAVGVIMYEMLTGRLPFAGTDPQDVIAQHVTRPVTRPKRLNPNIPGSLERIILRALAKAPEDRYQSAGEMRADLQAASQLIFSRRANPVAGMNDSGRPPRVLWVAATVALMMIMLAGSTVIAVRGTSFGMLPPAENAPTSTGLTPDDTADDEEIHASHAEQPTEANTQPVEEADEEPPVATEEPVNERVIRNNQEPPDEWFPEPEPAETPVSIGGDDSGIRGPERDTTRDSFEEAATEPGDGDQEPEASAEDDSDSGEESAEPEPVETELPEQAPSEQEQTVAQDGPSETAQNEQQELDEEMPSDTTGPEAAPDEPDGTVGSEPAQPPEEEPTEQEDEGAEDTSTEDEVPEEPVESGEATEPEEDDATGSDESDESTDEPADHEAEQPAEDEQEDISGESSDGDDQQAEFGSEQGVEGEAIEDGDSEGKEQEPIEDDSSVDDWSEQVEGAIDHESEHASPAESAPGPDFRDAVENETLEAIEQIVDDLNLDDGPINEGEGDWWSDGSVPEEIDSLIEGELEEALSESEITVEDDGSEVEAAPDSYEEPVVIDQGERLDAQETDVPEVHEQQEEVVDEHDDSFEAVIAHEGVIRDEGEDDD